MLFCHTDDAQAVIRAAHTLGLGAGYTWIGSEDVAQSDLSFFDSFAPRSLGFISLLPAPASTPAHTAYQAMAAALPSHAGNGTHCDPEVDDGGRPMWHYTDNNGALVCSGVSSHTGDAYGPFVYDAAFTAAHALHELIEVRGATTVDSAALYEAILNASFEGASGAVSFNRNPPGERFRGDRQAGAAYTILNYHPSAAAGGSGSLAPLGSWSYVAADATWEQRYVPAAGVEVAFASADGSRPDSIAPASDGFVRVGMLCEQSGVSPHITRHERCDRWRHVIEMINDKSDGFLDDLLPNVTIVGQAASVGCVDGLSRTALSQINADLPGVVALFGPGCSNDVAQLTNAAWRQESGMDSVVISGQSTAVSLNNDVEYPKLIRALPNEQWIAKGLVVLCSELQWTHVAVVYEPNLWGRSSKDEFIAELERTGGVLLVEHELDFGNSSSPSCATIDAARVLRDLVRHRAHVTFMAIHPQCQRELFAAMHDLEIMYGEGYAFMTSWVSEESFRNADGMVNSSAYFGALGLIGLDPGATSAHASTSATHLAYIERWGGARGATLEGCASYGPPYCDVDGDMVTAVNYAFQVVDAALLFAHGLHSLLTTGGISALGDTQRLHDAILALGSIEGVNGAITLGPDGDARSNIPVINLHQTVRQSTTQTQGLEPHFEVVGEFVIAENSLNRYIPLRYSGLHTTPVDSNPPIVENATSILQDAREALAQMHDILFYAIILFTVVFLALPCFVYAFIRYRLEQRAKQLSTRQEHAMQDAQRGILGFAMNTNDVDYAAFEAQKKTPFWFVNADFLRNEAHRRHGGDLTKRPTFESMADAGTAASGRRKADRELADKLRKMRDQSSTLLAPSPAPTSEFSSSKRWGLLRNASKVAKKGTVGSLAEPSRVSEASEVEPLVDEAPTLPSFQGLRARGENPLVRLLISHDDSLKHLYQRHILVVSHTWQEQSQPDKDGGQMRAVLAHLLDHPEIRYVWYDFWCMPQKGINGEARTPAETKAFKAMLPQVNFLYLGCSVLILLDTGYMSRFWTQFEAYIAMRAASLDGLTNAPRNRGRWTTVAPYATDSEKYSIRALEAEWLHCSVERAITKLSEPDVKVTNSSDKELMLPKIKQLDVLVKEMMHDQMTVFHAAAGKVAAAGKATHHNMNTMRSQASHPDLWASAVSGKTVAARFRRPPSNAVGPAPVASPSRRDVEGAALVQDEVTDLDDGELSGFPNQAFRRHAADQPQGSKLGDGES